VQSVSNLAFGLVVRQPSQSRPEPLHHGSDSVGAFFRVLV